jgi:hypothetical protein
LALAVEQTGRDEVLIEAVVDAGIGVAVELALSGAVTELIAESAVRNLGTDIEAFVEAEVAAVAFAIVRTFEALDAAERDDFLPLGPADLNDMARLVIAGADAEDIFLAVAIGTFAAWLARRAARAAAAWFASLAAARASTAGWARAA